MFPWVSQKGRWVASSRTIIVPEPARCVHVGAVLGTTELVPQLVFLDEFRLELAIFADGFESAAISRWQ